MEIRRNLVLVDGVDGAGATTIAWALQSLVGCYRDCVVVDLPKAGRQSLMAKAIREYEARTTHPDKTWITLNHMRVTNFVFQTVIKPLLNHRPEALVISVSNDVKNLTHAVANGHSDWVKLLAGGLVTAGALPGLRVLVDAPEKIIGKVIKNRIRTGTISKYDPHTQSEIIQRRANFTQACRLVSFEQADGVVQYLLLNDRRLNPSQIADNLVGDFNLLTIK
jgi:thymidylate kinase